MITIRPVKIDDAQSLCSIYNYYIKYTTSTFEYECLSVSDFAARISQISERYPYYVCEDNGIVVGYVYATVHNPRPAYDWNVTLSVYVDHEYTGRGVGRKLYDHIISTLRGLGYINVYAVVTSPNEKSEQFHKNYGFTHFATFEDTGFKFGSWLSVMWYRLVLTDTLPSNPSRPISPCER